MSEALHPDHRYRAESPSALVVTMLEDLTLIFHRPSGLTHIVAEPAPQILEVLGEEALTQGELLERLAALYDLAAEDEGMASALAARVEELCALGLVRRA